jgi:exonuclease SbcC
MAGVAPLEQVAHSLEREVSERQEVIGEIRAEWDSVDQDVQALGIKEGYLPKLEDTRHETQRHLQEVEQLLADIDAGLNVCTRNTEAVYRAESSKGRASFLRFLVFLLAVASGGLWALLTYGADLPQAELARGMLSQHVPEWDESRVLWIGYLAAGLGVLFLLLWIRVAGLKRRIRVLREESRQLADVLARSRQIDIEDIVDEEVVEQEGEEVPAEEAEEPVLERPAAEEFDTLKRLLDQGEATSRLASEYCDREVAWLGHVAQQLSAQLHELDEEIDDEQARLQEAINLSDVLNGLTDKREEIEARIADRRRGMELLEGAIAHLSNTFNHDVKELVGRMLPLFTDNRYEHLQIDEALNVRVFSNDKRDFMDFEEVSSGTQRQIMLALRLALSKKLLSRTVKGRQFAFLDEPFAFFDEERTRRALRALAELGDDISQVWIVAQDFPDNCEVEFDTVISCERNRDTLSVTA